MRLFIAVRFPQETDAYLRSLQDFLPDEGLAKAHSFHMTFKFLGEVSQTRVDQIIETLSRIKKKPFEIILDGIGTFGKKRPSVVWIAIKAPLALFELASDIERSMKKLAARPSRIGVSETGRCSLCRSEAKQLLPRHYVWASFGLEKPFVPHVTLARVKHASHIGALRACIDSVKTVPHSVHVRGFCLFRSQLSSECAVHTVLEHFPLRI